jgi:hypothetical protein
MNEGQVKALSMQHDLFFPVKYELLKKKYSKKGLTSEESQFLQAIDDLYDGCESVIGERNFKPFRLSEKEKLDISEVTDLFEYLKHGDKKHQDWLHLALICWNYGLERPAVQ